MQESLEKRTERFIKEQTLIEPGQRVLVGLSGGADSVCLLMVLRELSGGFPFCVGAFHVNHGIRGEEACRDEAFCRGLCERFEIEFFGVRKDVPAYAKEHGLGMEEAGREIRYSVAEQIAEEHGYDKIALAHQQEDVAETFLFHLFRGSSLGGLSSIPVKRGRMIRPILFCSRKEIEEYLFYKGLSFCTDATNGEDEYTRNKIRHNILSYAVNEINGAAVRHTAATAVELADLNAYLCRQAEEICDVARTVEDRTEIALEELQGLPDVILNKVIHTLLVKVTGSAKDITREHIASVGALLGKQSGKQVVLPYKTLAERQFDKLVIRRELSFFGQTKALQGSGEVELKVPGEYTVGNNGERFVLRLFPCEKNEQIPQNTYTKWYDYDKIRGMLRLRTRKEGDRIGMQQGSKTLKAVFTENKIEKEKRDACFLVADEAQVIWLPGVRSCDNYRVDESTRVILEITYCGGKT